MNIDWTINIGTVMHLITLVFALGAGYMRLSRKLDKLILQHNMIWRWFKSEHGINGDSEKRDA